MPRYDDVTAVQRRDKSKQIVCNTMGITLLVVPYWWDMKIESLAQTIHIARPDIVLPSSLLNMAFSSAIPTKMPQQRQPRGD